MTIQELTHHMVASANNDCRSLARLMVECISLIPLDLPLVATDAIKMANHYWVDETVELARLQRQIACWQYLRERSATCKFEIPETYAIRALICVLYPADPSEDILDITEFFIEMFRRALSIDNEEALTTTLLSVTDRFTNQSNLTPPDR